MTIVCFCNIMHAAMKKVRFILSVLLANVAAFAVKKINGTDGTSLPGLVALRCFEDFFNVTQQYCKKAIINITGTNGKTTTANIFAHILTTNKNSVVHNSKGANMLTGIASTLARALKTFKKHDYFVLESDEAYLTKLYDFINANYLLVTNLFQDQLDRYGSLENTYNAIQEAINKNPNLTVVLNADDPATSSMAENNQKIYFGIEDIVYHDSVDAPTIFENKITCTCGQDFDYDKLFYAHIGHFKCSCGKRRHIPDYSAKVKIYLYKSEIIITHNNIQSGFTTYMTGVYNAYNALGAIVTALELGIDKVTIQKALNTYEPVFGRNEKRVVKNKNTFVQLIKNPVAMTEALRNVQNTKKSKLLFAINDNYADGRDISWLWDTDFSFLENYENEIFVSGYRAYDVALRLQYAGVNPKKINVQPQIKQALNISLKATKDDETLMILPSYTALLNMQKIFKEFLEEETV